MSDNPWLISKDEIMTIAVRKGWFGCPRYLYRAEKMGRKCRELVKEGRLVRAPRNHPQSSTDTIVYVPTNVVVRFL